MACNFCKFDLYIKNVQYAKPLLAPMTKAEELRQQLLDLTGEVYLQIPIEYCAMCGEKIPRTPKERGGEMCADNIIMLKYCPNTISRLIRA